MSLSARRAWIEIAKSTPEEAKRRVALRKESVDRNVPGQNLINGISLSLSARRAWIEIENNLSMSCSVGKSLSARRAWIEIWPPYRLY